MRKLRNTHEAIKTKQRRWSEFWRNMFYEKNLMGTKKDPFDRVKK